VDAERLGFADVAPLAPYRHVYPLDGGALANLAYYFAFRYREPQDVESYVEPLARQLRAWQRSHRRSALFSVDTGDGLLIWDLRPVARQPLTVLRGLDRALYQACDAACDLRQLSQVAGNGDGPGPDEVERRLAHLTARGLLWKDGSRYLALAVPVGEYTPPDWAVARVYQIARRLGRRTADDVVVPLATESAGRNGRSTRPRSPAGRGTTARRSPHTLDPSRFSLDGNGDLVIRLPGR
jgi:hypothetical protein